jgi:hypothetical protein
LTVFLIDYDCELGQRVGDDLLSEVADDASHPVCDTDFSSDSSHRVSCVDDTVHDRRVDGSRPDRAADDDLG